MEQYVVTGVGIYNGLGKNASKSWYNLIDGKSAILPLLWPEDDASKFPSTYKTLKAKVAAISPAPKDDYPEYFSYGWSNWDPNTRTCMLAVDEALIDSGIQSKNLGVVVSTFGSGTELRLELFTAMNNGVKKVSPRKTLNIGLDFPAAQVAAVYKVTGPNTSMDSACTTGISSIDHAISTLKANPDLDGMIVGASDRMAEPIYMYWFQSLGALSVEDSVTASRPFDLNRNGFVMGEGASTLIIEPLSKAIARNAKIYGIVKSTSFVTIFDSDTSPDPEGTGAKLCAKQAISKAGITAEDIDYINAHATSTPVGDQVEYDAMLDVVPGKVMSSNKGQIGHCMSGAGIVETIYTLLSMNHGIVPGTANLEAPCGQGMILPTAKKELDIKYALKNSFGFGGRCASLVLERYDG